MASGEPQYFSIGRKLACVIALLAALLCGWVEVLGLDTWWHFAIGRSALETGSTLPRDIFSYSFAGAPWPYKDLAAAVLLYLGYHALGDAFFFVLKAGFVLSLAALFLLRRRLDPLLGLSIFALLLLAIAYTIVDRPLLFSLALLPWCVLALERLHAAARDPALPAAAIRRRVLVVLALIYFGTLLHRGTLVAYALLGAHALEALLASFAPPTLARAWLGGPTRRDAALLTAGAALCSPLLALWLWLRYRRSAPESARPSLLQPALLLLFSALACTSVRWVPQLAMVAAVHLLVDAESLSRSSAGWPGRTRALAMTLVSAGLLTMLAVHYPLAHRWGLRPEFEPIGAMKFAREQRLGARMANAFNLGGYPLWAGHPVQRVLIDGRSDQVYPSAFILRVLDAERSPALFAGLEREYGFDWVIACNRPGQLSHTFLASDPAWSLVYYSEAALIYVRSERYPGLAPLRFRVLEPVAPDLAVLRAMGGAAVEGPTWRALAHELARARAASPLGLRILASSALFFHHSGPAYGKARDQALATLLREYPDHPVLPQLAQLLKARPMAPGAH
jgi:hypothetical protein